MNCPNCRTDIGEDSRFCYRCGTPTRSTESTLLPVPRARAGSEEIVRQGVLFAGRYRILEEIGRGGMGVVYRADDTKLRRTVALKLLPPEFLKDAKARARLVREAQAAAALDHPSICTVFEVDEAEGETFITMAFVEGRSLKEVLAGGPMEIAAAVDLAVQVAEGLAAAHEKGVVHRDIKPGNLMVGERNRVKIMDFGLARLEGAADLTGSRTVMGTVAYMSPEQARGKKVDGRSDIWSLGCTLYEMLTGCRAFASEREAAAVHSILHEEPPTVSALRKDIPPGLEPILERCLQKDPRNRYPDAGRLAAELASAGFHGPAAASSAPARVARKESVPSLAVMPFVDMSPGKDQGYIGDGLAEELISALTRIRGLRVVARTSAFALKDANLDARDIGRTLNVKHLVEGSVRKAGGRLRITAQLVNLEDGFDLWSERFDRNVEDIFAVQDEIATAIVEGLKLTLLAGERAALRKRPTNDPDAYSCYLKGLHFAGRPNPEAYQKALGFFRDALDRDPTFAAAHAGMASVFASLGILNLAPPAEMLPKAKAALQAALSLDESLAEAHLVAATIAFWFEWDWEAAGRGIDRALAVNPGHAFGHGLRSWFFLNRMRFDEAISEVKQALALDPLMPLFLAWSVGIHAGAGRPDEALVEFRRAIELDPRLGLAYFHAGVASLEKGLYAEATALLEKSRELVVFPGWAEGLLGLIAVKTGDEAGARRILGEMIEARKRAPGSPVAIAWLAAALGDFDLAFEFFDKACVERDTLMVFVHVYTRLLAPRLQEEPRFQALLARIGVAGGSSRSGA